MTADASTFKNRLDLLAEIHVGTSEADGTD